MTKTMIVAAGLAMASSASADLTGATHSNILSPEFYTLTATPIGAPDLAGVLGTAYSNMDAGAGFQAFPVGGPSLGFDDYDSIATGGTIDVQSYRFVGGVNVAGGVMFFEFFDSTSTFVDSFGVALPQAGNFIWTITINTFPGGVVIPDAGIHQVVTDDVGAFGPAALGQWFLSDANPTIGTSNPAIGGAAGGFSHKFEINGEFVPAPATAALMGLGGLVAARRRR